MFAGVAPFSIVIAKKSKAKKVFSNEINREANKYAEINIKLNKVNDKVELINGDIKRIAKKISTSLVNPSRPPRGEKISTREVSVPKTFDVVVMPRPQLKDSFLQQAFMLSKKGTRIYYYDFCRVEDIDSIVDKIKKEAEKFGKKIKILKVKRAGEIAPYKTRLRVDFQIV
jgi:tRNA (guanine37-N1)-methyltransferase